MTIFLNKNNMYIKQLENYTNKDWDELKYNLEIYGQDFKILKQILTFGTKQEIEKHFWFLEKIWIINWIWPWFLWKKFIKIISFLFKWVKYEWHDIIYYIWWNTKDKLKSDYWLLKYSIISIQEKIKEIYKINLNYYAKWLVMWSYLLSLLITIPIIIFCFIIVVLFWFMSFNYKNNEII